MKFKQSLVCIVLTISCQIISATELTFVMQRNFEPFNYVANGYPQGPAVDIIHKVCKKLGWKCNIKVLPWVRAQEATRAGQYEAIFTVGWNASRNQWLYYTYPLMETEYGFFARTTENPKPYLSLKDLDKKTIIVYGPSNTSKRLERLKKLAEQQGISFKIDIDVNNGNTIKRLVGNRGDLLFSNRDVGKALAKKEGKDNEVSYIGQAFPPYHYYIGFSRSKSGNFKLFSQFNAAYKKLVDSGEIDRLLENVNQTLGDHEKGSQRTHNKK